MHISEDRIVIPLVKIKTQHKVKTVVVSSIQRCSMMIATQLMKLQKDGGKDIVI